MAVMVIVTVRVTFRVTVTVVGPISGRLPDTERVRVEPVMARSRASDG